MRILVTGAAGFIGYHIASRLLAEGEQVLGIDNLNAYYDPRLKRARIERIAMHPGFRFTEIDIADRSSMVALFDLAGFELERFDLVIHLAAQAGVRHSIEHPHVYVESNIAGFLNVLEGCRRGRVKHLIYASSSSVYGDNAKTPFRTEDRADTPISLYAATKKANELMAHCYTHLYGIPATGLRFFTVYGPWGRPDMAPFRFLQAIDRGERIDVYNHGHMRRDFTYIDDAVEGLFRVAMRPPKGYRLFNLGSSRPVELMEFIGALERALGKKARKRFLPLQAGDVVATHADVEDLCRFTGFRPSTSIETGVRHLVDWYTEYREFLRDGRAVPAVASQAEPAMDFPASGLGSRAVG